MISVMRTGALWPMPAWVWRDVRSVFFCFAEGCKLHASVLHGESITDQASPRANRRKQCSPKPYSKPTLPRKRQTTPTNGHRCETVMSKWSASCIDLRLSCEVG